MNIKNNTIEPKKEYHCDYQLKIEEVKFCSLYMSHCPYQGDIRERVYYQTGCRGIQARDLLKCNIDQKAKEEEKKPKKDMIRRLMVEEEVYLD